MLIGMAVYDTEENERSWMTKATLLSLAKTVDFEQHRLIISDNGSCRATHEIYLEMNEVLPFQVIFNGENLGTANAVNLAWRKRNPGEHCVKMDNDVEIRQPHWADWMEDVFRRDPQIGICGLKRKDLAECPWSNHEWYRSFVRMLPHEAGERWIIIEEVGHVMGTCQAYSSALLDKIGYLYQPTVYGFDDSLAAVRAAACEFKSVFLHGFEIDHIDPGLGKYGQWKRDHAGEYLDMHAELARGYKFGRTDPYYDGGFTRETK